uniref:Uncharacterized protein n=1 Tax=Pundamilia nyererei TaxID=303518 RepID=A0A3B4GFB8_9CICH
HPLDPDGGNVCGARRLQRPPRLFALGCSRLRTIPSGFIYVRLCNAPPWLVSRKIHFVTTLLQTFVPDSVHLMFIPACLNGASGNHRPLTAAPRLKHFCPLFYLSEWCHFNSADIQTFNCKCRRRNNGFSLSLQLLAG